MEGKLKNKYHTDDLIIELLLQDLEYKEIKPILKHRVYSELGGEARSQVEKILSVLEETEYIKRTDNKNAELLLGGLNVKKIGGWLKYQESLNKKRKNKKVMSYLKNIGLIIGIIFTVLKIAELSIKHTKSKSTVLETQITSLSPCFDPYKTRVIF